MFKEMLMNDRAMPIVIRMLRHADAVLFAQAFRQQGWNKPESQFYAYLDQMIQGMRQVFVADYEGRPIGYVCLLPKASHGPFSKMSIPYLSDFNVLVAFQHQGIGSMLMDAAEQAAFDAGATDICLGVGLHPGYGAAQRMYIKRGYVPDGSGIWYQNKLLPLKAPCFNDDDLVIYMRKELH